MIVPSETGYVITYSRLYKSANRSKTPKLEICAESALFDVLCSARHSSFGRNAEDDVVDGLVKDLVDYFRASSSAKHSAPATISACGT